MRMGDLMQGRIRPLAKAGILAVFAFSMLLVSCYYAGGDDDSSGFVAMGPDHESPIGGLIPAQKPVYRFPDDFLWGVSTSAYQTEGDNFGSDYDVWNRHGHGSDICGEADRSYEMYETDADLAAALGVTAYRVGIEWARIEPVRGQYNEAEIHHYRRVLQAIVDRGMKPVVTLHHFTNPLWVEEQGGWLNVDTVDRFVKYSELMAADFGDLVDWWLTINEPVIYTMGAYMVLAYPGGRFNDFSRAMQATVNMIFAHARAYHAIKEADRIDADGDGKASMISIAKALYPVSPLHPDNPGDVKAAQMYDYVFDRLYLRAVVNGMLDVDGDGKYDNANANPPEGYYEELAGTLDFLGINYYNPLRVIHIPFIYGTIQGVPCFPQANLICYPGGREPYIHGDNDNEIYPEGILELIEDYQSEFKIPVMITENGVATTDGYLRSWFIIEHLKKVHDAIDAGYNVLGYLYWSLLDNFEWSQGYSMRFGLYTVDYSVFQRVPTEASETYSEIVHAGGMTQDVLERYAETPAIH